MQEVLKIKNLDNGVRLLTLNRPEVLNSLNKDLVDSLINAFDDIYHCLLYTSPSPRDS